MGKTHPWNQDLGWMGNGEWGTQGGVPNFFFAEDSEFFQTRISKSFPAYLYSKPKIPGTLNSHLGGPFDDASIAPHSEDPKG